MNPAALSEYKAEPRVRRKFKRNNDARIVELEEIVRSFSRVGCGRDG